MPSISATSSMMHFGRSCSLIFGMGRSLEKFSGKQIEWNMFHMSSEKAARLILLGIRMLLKRSGVGKST